MKEVQTAPEKTIVIDIKLTRGLVVTLSCVLVLLVLVTFVTLAGDNASASEREAAQAASAGMRQFYLTSENFDGDQVLNACAAGYHMASLWEITDPSNLNYNTALGRTRPDSGQGPPFEWGWVRTGYESYSSAINGRANCDSWTDDYDLDFGTMASLPSDWAGGEDHIGVWTTLVLPCDIPVAVWCIED